MINTNSTQTPAIALHDFEPATETMRRDVLRGLAQRPKSLPSQYLYDERGAALFEQICETDEYYLTRTETGIMRRHMPAIAERIGPGAVVIEPGSGSGIKTRLLLEGLDRPAAYMPIDVSRRQLSEFATRVDREFPDLQVHPICADFTRDYELPNCDSVAGTRVTYLPGSTIGNFTPESAVALLERMIARCGDTAAVLIGIDLKKDVAVLEAAYDDAAGVSRAFALNYLVRLNRELGADFDLSNYGYEAPYNETLDRIEMALVSLTDQEVRVGDTTIRLERHELIRTELSHKYSNEAFAELTAAAGLEISETWTDDDGLFSVLYLLPR